MLSQVHAIQTALYVTEFLLSYAVMLCVMTFNAYLLIAVAFGAMTGFQLCRFFSRPHLFGHLQRRRSADKTTAKTTSYQDMSEKCALTTRTSETAVHEQKQFLTSI